MAEETRGEKVASPNRQQDSAIVEITADQASLAEHVVDEALGGEIASEDNSSIGSVAQEATGREKKGQEDAEGTPEAAEIAEETIEERAQEATAETTEESLQYMVAGSSAGEMSLETIPGSIAAVESSSLAIDEESAQIDAEVSKTELNARWQVSPCHG